MLSQNAVETSVVGAEIPELTRPGSGGGYGHPVGERAAALGGVAKRSFDLTAALLLILFLTPLLLSLAVLILAVQGRPLLIRHRRLGCGGRTFPCLKLRTMVVDCETVLSDHLKRNPEAREEWRSSQKLKVDPRVTPLGQVLRSTSLDELPQLFNVVRGDMSLVGPRPIVQEETVKYGELIEDYYCARPGITGIWQISGRNDLSYDQKVLLDSRYVRTWSFFGDVGILFRTLPAVLLAKGSY